MPNHNAHSQSTLESTNIRTSETSIPTKTSVEMHNLACDKLIEEAVDNNLPASTLLDGLKELGLKASEAVDYITEFNQHITILHSKAIITTPHQRILSLKIQTVLKHKKTGIELLKKLPGLLFIPNLSPQLLTHPQVSL